MRIRRIIRRLVILFKRVEGKELRRDQEMVSKGLALRLGKPKWEVDTAVFEIGMMTLAAVALEKVPDTFNLWEYPGLRDLLQAVKDGWEAGS